MRKILLRRCQNSIISQIQEESMISIGKELFGNKIPKQDIPMIYSEKIKEVRTERKDIHNRIFMKRK